MGKISSTSQKISLRKQKLPPPNLKSFNMALNKKILFLFPLAGMKNSLKKRFHLTEKLFSKAGKSAKWRELQPEKLFLLGVKKFF